MRARRIILYFVLFVFSVIAVFAILGWSAIHSYHADYRRFLGKDQRYYAGFAGACDSLLQQHPLGTNSFIRLTGDKRSLPRIIRDLEIGSIMISSNRVHILVGSGRLRFGITWEPQDEGQTNAWILSTHIEGAHKVAYVQTRR